MHGGPEAEEYCRRVRPRLVGALSLYCGDAQVAEDATQEALARVWDHWPAVRQMASPDSWTFRVAFNLTHSWFRSVRAQRRREERFGREAAREHGADLSEAVAVRAAVARLPRRQKQALVLRYFEDLSVADTAEVMGCSPGTVKALTSQAIVRLRQDPAVPDMTTVEVPDVS